jgi:hypothetical protein
METRPASVDVLVAEFLAERERNPATPADGYVARLPAEQHQEFRALLETVGVVDAQFPTGRPLRQVLAGRYQLQCRLGEGGFGDVWQALDRKLHKQVAVKVLQRGLEAGWVGDALREARILAELDHPGIVRILDAGDDAGLPFLVMELVPGRTLAQVLQSVRNLGRQPGTADLFAALGGAPQWAGSTSGRAGYHRAVARLFAEAARALHAAHARGVVHRDLKPANLLFRPGGAPTWLDFGLAGHVHSTDGRSLQHAAGTPQYMAPEQLRSGGMVKDARVDVYQFGTLLYEALTREPAFPADERERIYARILAGDFAWPRRLDHELPRTLEDVCLRAMHPTLEGRYPDLAALALDLERAAAGELPEAARGRVGPFSPLRAGLFARRHRRSLLVGGALAAALVLGLMLGGGGRYRLEVSTDPYLYAVIVDRAGGVTPARIVHPEAVEVAPGSFGARLGPGRHDVEVRTVHEPGAGGRIVVHMQPQPDERLEQALVKLSTRPRGAGFDLALARRVIDALPVIPGESTFTADQLLGEAPWRGEGRRVTLAR